MTTDFNLQALVVDVGNSKVRVAGWRGGNQDVRQVKSIAELASQQGARVPTLGEFSTPDPLDVGSFCENIAGIGDTYPGLPVVATSVVPHVLPLLQATWPSVISVDHTSSLPFKLALPQPAAIGPDRLCNMAAAAAAGCGDTLVVDAGTATTFDLLVGGEFIGGLIAPGMALAAECLANTAERLSPVPFASCPLKPGCDTRSAMQAGAFHTGTGGVDAVVSGLGRAYTSLTVIVTGGLCGFLNRTDRICDPDWTLRGAIVLAGTR